MRDDRWPDRSTVLMRRVTFLTALSVRDTIVFPLVRPR